MGFFFRRSTSFGPFRLNLSKSGIGASVGVKGARLTLTPRGTTYITVGSHGFYYRETLSHGTGAPAQTPVAPHTAVSYAGEIVTAPAADLVDSSVETVVNRLNERQKMFNPAWLIYAAAAAALISGLVMLSTAQDLRDVSASAGAERRSNTTDEYGIFVARYGEPNSILESHPLRLVSVRTADYSSALLKVVFVPNGCVDTYKQAERVVGEQARNPKAKKSATDLKPCVPAAAGWTAVRYVDRRTDHDISAEDAKELFGRSPVKRADPPAFLSEDTPTNRPKLNAKDSKKKTTEPDLKRTVPQPDRAADQKGFAVAEAAERKSVYSSAAVLLSGLVLFVIGGLVHKKNKDKRTSRLFYELGEPEQQRYVLVQQAWAELAKCHHVWRIQSQVGTPDWKRNAGVSTLVGRAQISVGYATPPRVVTNVSVPCLNIGSAKVFFLPDVILYSEHGTYGDIAYADFQIRQAFTRFVEDGPTPADGTVVDRRGGS